MKIAYIILAHKNIAQIHGLLEAIQGENIEIYLHLDRLAGTKFYRDAVHNLSCIQNIHLIRRYATSWGSFGLVKATLEGIRQIVKTNNADYAILLSGQDFPIKSHNALEELLAENNGNSFMEYFQLPNPEWKDRGGVERIKRWYFSFPCKKTRFNRWIRVHLNQMMNILQPERKFPQGFMPFGGAQWWCLHKDCYTYIDTFVKQHTRFVHFFKSVRIPDELLFHTILLNSPLKSRIINRKLTYVDWSGPPFPRILGSQDINRLQTMNHYFARKFDLDITPGIFNTLAELMSLTGFREND